MIIQLVLALSFVIMIFVVLPRILPIKKVIILEHQKGLQYTRGKYVRTLDPGQYWISSFFTSVVPIDVRREFVTIPGQDVLSSDGVTLKVSLTAEFEVADPHIAVNKNADFRASLYMTLQLAIREIVGSEKIDALLEKRTVIGSKLMEISGGKASDLGLKLFSANIKDIMLPGEMKKVFGQVVKAQKDGKAALERARGETAALRNLANAARTITDNPNLLQLRTLQVLSESPGNTVVFGLTNGPLPIPKLPNPNITPQRPDEEPEEK